MKKQLSVVLALTTLSLVVACAPQTAPAPAAQAPAPVPAAAASAVSAKPAWQEKWDKTLEAAKKEGRISIATGAGGLIRTAMMEGPKAAYGLPVESYAGASQQIVTKILAERRAGLYLYDAFAGTATTALTTLTPVDAFEPLTPALILPEVTEPELIKKTWYQGELYWVDKDRTVLGTVGAPGYPMAINTNLIKEGEIKSWRDILHPKWQGKLALFEPNVSAGRNVLAFIDERLGWDYFVELIKTKPIVLNNKKLMLDWLAFGKIAITLGQATDLLPEYIQIGAPVRPLTPEEGTYISGVQGNIFLFKNPPHPNAAKVFVNWFVSKEGQTAISKAGDFHSLRLDVPTDHLAPWSIRDPKMKYVDTMSEDSRLRMAELGEKSKPLYAPLMGK